MQQDLVVAKSLNDIGGECRAHGNMGAAHFSKGNFKEALTSHRYQLVLAMKRADVLACTQLLQAQADPNHQDPRGACCLHAALGT